MATQDKADFSDYARSLGTVMDYADGDVVFREGDSPKFLYFVLSGSIEVSIRQKPIERIEKGQAVGLMGMIDDQPRTITAMAKGPCEVALVDKKKFRFMVEEIPHFVWFVLGELGTRLRSSNAALS